MKKGVLFFSYNAGLVNYSGMTKLAATLVKLNLKLPTAVVTDTPSDFVDAKDIDHVIVDTPNEATTRHFGELGIGAWYNSGRERTLELSPFDRTLVLDADFLVLSGRLLKTLAESFGIVRSKIEVGTTAPAISYLGYSTIPVCWASVLLVSKGCPTSRDVLTNMSKVRNNWAHYANWFNFGHRLYRSDYALTLGVYLASGQRLSKLYDLPYVINNLPQSSVVTAVHTSPPGATILLEGVSSPVTLNNTDFHVMNKSCLTNIQLSCEETF